MIAKDKKIAIIGGGPGGLTLARLLQQEGLLVKVYERDANRNMRVQGSTLDLHADSGLKAIEKAGLLDAFKEKYRPGADLTRVADKEGNLVYDQHGAEPQEMDFDSLYARPEIDRGPLRDILLDSLHADTVSWNSHIVSISKNEAGSWLLQFEDGTTETADLIIGADGARSKIRSYVTDIKPVYSGITMVEGTVYHAAENAPLLWELTKGGKVFAMGDHKTLITSSKEDGCLSFYTGCKTDENWVKDSSIDFDNHLQLLKWFKETYQSWGSIWEELFSNEHTSFIPRPQYYMPLDQTWPPHADITIIGDAAHVMPPYAGEGVNMAMKDALELSEHLTSDAYPDLQTAIGAFEKQMRERAVEITKMTLEQTDTMHAEGALEHLVQLFGN